MDAILEAYAKDNPTKLKFERRRRGEHSLDTVEALSVQWSDRLIGKAKEDFKNKVSFSVPNAYKPSGQHMAIPSRSPRLAPRRRP